MPYVGFDTLTEWRVKLDDMIALPVSACVAVVMFSPFSLGCG